MVFGNYSEFYDVFYHGKDYEGEASFLETLWREKALPPTSVLDLGCGTGGHLFSLVEKGYQVVGVDLSATMLMEARHKLMECKKSVYLIQGDMRDIRLERTFDVVISMFAVMGYQRDNQDFLDALRTARAHLEISGWFIFDAWYGPAVLRILPETR
ncbi:class I SAM-dependent methyltransferase, partial [Candidatus Parcubacteria bacterium]